MPWGARSRTVLLRTAVFALLWFILTEKADAVPFPLAREASSLSGPVMESSLMTTWPIAKFGRQVLSLQDIEEDSGEEEEGQEDEAGEEDKPLLSYKVKRVESDDREDGEDYEDRSASTEGTQNLDEESTEESGSSEDDNDEQEDDGKTLKTVDHEEGEEATVEKQPSLKVQTTKRMSKGKKNKDEDESDLQDTDNADLEELEEPKDFVRASKPKPKTSGSIAAFRGIELGLVGETNISRLSYMTFKLIKAYNIKSMVDIPCHNTVKWMPRLLERLDYEIVGFKYYCVTENGKVLKSLKRKFGEHGNPEFKRIAPEESRFLPQADLVFTWDGLQEWGVKRSWTFFNGLREVRPKYVILSNNPGTANTHSQRRFLNVRKQPFHFSQAMRVVSNMTSPHAEPKQLLLYELKKIRKGF